MTKILIVEDDQAISDGMVLALKQEGYTFKQCGLIKDAAAEFQRECPDLIILDINLPDGDGCSWCREVRQSSSVPILMVTAKDLEMDEVTGLESGADDYITKPFSLMVLRSRVGALLRRSRVRAGKNRTEGRYEYGPFRFDFQTMQYYRGSEEIQLSKTEQKLLRMLTENKNHTLSREVLVDRIWSDGAEYVDNNALSVSIKRLRSKLGEDAGTPAFIRTVYGIGYAWQEEGA